ncbi:hypothetical protein [Vibrio coralliilyticus]|uniref:hypothetical protein n=1 Tax=Vibrio coralliilyticus TaxID=190893 RepID=UPI0006CD4118|nr:hypothetical protein [Vibrio coralliilyticus]AXN30056.1 DUF2079 domain-containing protein [Vibrio coralliilyticus]KPH25449.1 hypothetical protein ADU60_09315 [Vibrio coralliilyticus]
MNTYSLFSKFKRVYKIALYTIFMAALSFFSLYLGFQKVMVLGEPIGNIETYSRFDFAAIPMGIGLFIVVILGVFYIITEEKWEDRHGATLPLSLVGLLITTVLVTLITPSIYETRYEKAGLQQCKGIPTGHLPLFAKKFATDPSLCYE